MDCSWMMVVMVEMIQEKNTKGKGEVGVTTLSLQLTNSAHDTGVMSEGEREIARRNWWCNFCPATTRIKLSKRHIGRPKPAICKASVSTTTMTEISESSDWRTQS